MDWQDYRGWPKWPSRGGGVGARPRPKTEPLLPEPEPVLAPSQKPGNAQPKAKLSNPTWSESKAFFDEKAHANVDGELPAEISHFTKVQFTLYAKLPDGSSQRIDSKDGHLHDGKASVEFDLWSPGQPADAGKRIKSADYYFVAKHRDSGELESGFLTVSRKLISRTLNARLLKRGVRGEDVLAWQRFLKRLRTQSEFSEAIPDLKADGIFGIETRKATAAFQAKVGQAADGAVGPDTREEAELLGALFVVVDNPGKAEATPQAVRQGKIPVFPPPPAPLPAVAPPGPIGSTREESWKRLRAEGWKQRLATLEKSGAIIQSVADGTGDYVYDEYKVVIAEMPKGIGPADFLKMLESDLNGTIRNPGFDAMNVFKRRTNSPPAVGEIIDIDIALPDNGSVVLAEAGPTYFIYQTIECPETGSHPENGAREFGFQLTGSSVIFYTRGVSRPSFYLIRILGALPQMVSWTELMKGISDRVNALGGKSIPNSFTAEKVIRDN